MTKQQKKHVLVVDDESNVVFLLAEGLRKLGDEYMIETASNGPEAVNKLGNQHYDMLITDYRMPGMSGLELAQIVRKRSPETRVVLMTAYGTSALHDVVGSLKLDGYLDKPVSIQEVRQIVQHAIGQTYQGEDPFRAGDKKVDDEVEQHLQTLQQHTNAHCTLLLSAGGYPISMAGHNDELDIATISALVAANFMAASELARLLGNDSIFKSSYHEGPNYDIYAHDINGECFIAVIFGSESKAGIVRFYTNSMIKKLTPLLDQIADSTGQIDPAFANDVNNELADMFGPDSADDSIMSLEEAIRQGLVPAEIGEVKKK